MNLNTVRSYKCFILYLLGHNKTYKEIKHQIVQFIRHRLLQNLFSINTSINFIVYIHLDLGKNRSPTKNIFSRVETKRQDYSKLLKSKTLVTIIDYTLYNKYIILPTIVLFFTLSLLSSLLRL